MADNKLDPTLLPRYEIPAGDLATTLEGVVWVYENLIDSLGIETVSTQAYESKVREMFAGKMGEEMTELLEFFAARVWDILDECSEDPSDAVALFDWLGEFKKVVCEERDYQVRVYARENKPRAILGDDYEAKKKDALGLRDFASALVTNLGMMGHDIPETVPFKDGKMSLSQLPKGNRLGGGRKAATAGLRLIVNGEIYSTWSIEKVCHDILSSGTNRVTVSSLLDAVKQSNEEEWKSVAAKGFSLITINGHEVSGFTVSTDEDEAEESDESDEGNESNADGT